MEKLLKLIYDLELENSLLGLAGQLKASPRAYEVAFNYWLNHQIDDALKACPSSKKGDEDVYSRRMES